MSTWIRVEGGQYVETYRSDRSLDDLAQTLALASDGLPKFAFLEVVTEADDRRCLISVTHIVDIREADE